MCRPRCWPAARPRRRGRSGWAGSRRASCRRRSARSAAPSCRPAPAPADRSGARAAPSRAPANQLANGSGSDGGVSRPIEWASAGHAGRPSASHSRAKRDLEQLDTHPHIPASGAGSTPIPARNGTSLAPRNAPISGHARLATCFTTRPEGLYCPPGDFFIDPVRPVRRALITHGHSDHARAGHDAVLATQQTLDIMAIRYGADFAGAAQAAASRRDASTINGVTVTFHPAGHVLGSAQIAVEHGGMRIVVSGDYKRQRRSDLRAPSSRSPATCSSPRRPSALPVFRHPDDRERDRQAARIRSRSFPSAPIWSAPMRSARRSA